MTASPERFQARTVRSRARPGSFGPFVGRHRDYAFPIAAITMASDPTTTIPKQSTRGMTERGSGSPRRIARSFERRFAKLVIARITPQSNEGEPEDSRQRAPVSEFVINCSRTQGNFALNLTLDRRVFAHRSVVGTDPFPT